MLIIGISALLFKKIHTKTGHFSLLSNYNYPLKNPPMKKTLLFIFTLVVSTQLFAQSKSQILLYGSISGRMAKNEWGQKNTNARAAPGVGYHITDRLAVGVQGLYSMNSYQDTGVIKFKRNNSNWAVGPFVRYTQPLGEMFFLFGQLDLGYGKQIAGSINGTKIPNLDVMELSAGFYPSVGIYLNNGFALNFAFGGLNYKYTKSEASPNPGHDVTLNFGHAFQFGVSKFFGGYGKDALNNRYN